MEGAGRLARRSGYWLVGGCAVIGVTALDGHVVLASVADADADADADAAAR
ncbi:hypothetical protein ACSNOB_00145 [Micromonospora sp. URMC 106]|uniref:hypothetical protein n=1 Tax=Micromonospora sp. URMC 106 TaxID=3423408 RepID=UPI003F1C5B05